MGDQTVSADCPAGAGRPRRKRPPAQKARRPAEGAGRSVGGGDRPEQAARPALVVAGVEHGCAASSLTAGAFPAGLARRIGSRRRTLPPARALVFRAGTGEKLRRTLHHTLYNMRNCKDDFCTSFYTFAAEQPRTGAETQGNRVLAGQDFAEAVVPPAQPRSRNAPGPSATTRLPCRPVHRGIRPLASGDILSGQSVTVRQAPVNVLPERKTCPRGNGGLNRGGQWIQDSRTRSL